MKICRSCGKIIDEDTEFAYVVNSGLENQYTECETCHDSSWETNKIIICDACGEWITPDVLRSESIGNDTFCPCPICGKDIVDGTTREVFKEEHA